MYIRYARISTQDQNHNIQTDALKLVGCGKIFTDKVSGTNSERPGLTKLKEKLRKGDTLVIWRLDRLARSLKDLIEWVAYLEKEGIALAMKTYIWIFELIKYSLLEIPCLIKSAITFKPAINEKIFNRNCAQYSCTIKRSNYCYYTL